MDLTAGFLLILLGCVQAANGAEEQLIGWKGETYRPKELMSEDDEVGNSTLGDKRRWVQVLSWKPRAFVYHNFLSDAEAAHIIKLAAPQMKRSTVVGPQNKGVVDNIRTSAGTFLGRNLDPVITGIEARLALWSGVPPSHQEDMQVLRYGPTNKYGAHLDGLGRVASVLIYLIPPEEGGETAFPESQGWINPDAGEPSQGAFSECAKGHVAYKPKRGDALMFWDMKPDGQSPDPYSQHTGCPVVKGVKWNAVKWIHGVPFREDDYKRSLTDKHEPPGDPGLCVNTHTMCDTWAKAGECQKNPSYMMGGPQNQGGCRLACKDCKECTGLKGEAYNKCYRENRSTGGFINIEEAELKLAEIGVPAGTVSGTISAQ